MSPYVFDATIRHKITQLLDATQIRITSLMYPKKSISSIRSKKHYICPNIYAFYMKNRALTITALVFGILSAISLLLKSMSMLSMSGEMLEFIRNIAILLVSASVFQQFSSRSTTFIVGFLTLGVAIVTTLIHAFNVFPIPFYLPEMARWVFLGGVFHFALEKKSLTTWIFVSMLIGVAIGNDHAEIALNFQVLSKIFIRLIKTIVAPLLFATLVVGIAGHSNMKQVGRMGWKSLLYFEVVTTIALFIGLAAINFSQAGVGIVPPTEETVQPKVEVAKKTPTDIILHIFPENLAKSVAEGAVLQIVIFSILFGIALSMLDEEKRKPLLHFAESLSETMFKFTNLIMYYAPIGVGAAIAYTVGHMGIKVLIPLLWLLITLYAALAVFILCVLVPIALYNKIPLMRFANAITEPVSIAFATTSSDAALPKAMEVLEKFGVPRKIIAFVLPTGYSFNLDGTTLYLALASIFVAQAAGKHMDFSQQLVMMLTLMLTSKGVAAVPRASLIILFGTASSFDLPLWPIYLILGIDELMDMARTAVNIMGNCLATVVIARWEGEWDASKIQD